MTLKPPAEITGRVHAKTPREIIKARAAWIEAQYTAGNSYPAIAEALGVSATAARTAVHRHRNLKTRPKRANIGPGKMRSMGLYTGNLGGMFYSLPIDQQNHLIDLAIKRKTTIANALIGHYLEIITRPTKA